MVVQVQAGIETRPRWAAGPRLGVVAAKDHALPGARLQRRCAAGAHGLSITAAGEKVRKEILVSAGLDRAPAIGRYGGGLREVHVDHAPLLVGLPGSLHEWLSAAAACFNGGRGLLPAQTAVGPWTAYLVLAVLAMLALQRLTGYR